MENNSLDINAVCFGILCNFTPICGKERAEEAAGLVRSLQVDNDRLLDEVTKWKKKYVEANGNRIVAENKWRTLDNAVKNGSVYTKKQEELDLAYEENQSLKDINAKLWDELDKNKRQYCPNCGAKMDKE